MNPCLDLKTSNLNAKKSAGLSDLFKDYTPQQLEEQKRMMVNEAEVSLLLKIYEELLNTIDSHLLFAKYFRSRIADIDISAKTVNLFLQSAIAYESNPRHNYYYFGECLQVVMQRSYDVGFTHFTLNTMTIPQAKYWSLSVVGKEGKEVNIHLHGDSKSTLGDQSQYTVYTVEGQITYFPPDMATHGVDDYIRMPEWCTFKSPHKEVVEIFNRWVPRWRGNKIMFIREGQEEIIRDDKHY